MQAKLADLCICEKMKAWKKSDSNQDSVFGIWEPGLEPSASEAFI